MKLPSAPKCAQCRREIVTVEPISYGFMGKDVVLSDSREVTLAFGAYTHDGKIVQLCSWCFRVLL